MSIFVIDLVISSDEILKEYQGTVRTVQAYDLKGRSIRFPAAILRPYVTREGIRGRFQLEIDENNKFKDIKRLN